MNIVLCWHMHQPDYRLGGRYLKPWTWLHAIKDYSDMAAHLERVPGARAVVNFSPVLIEQLQDYPRRIRALLERSEPVGDLVLDALGGIAGGDRAPLLAQLLRVNEKRMKSRFDRYSRLADRAKAVLEGGGDIDDQEVHDLLVWYVIAWLGECLRGLPLVRDLAARKRDYSAEDRCALLAMVAGVLEELLPRYRKLAGDGAIELSVTPYAHPILPLLLDFESASEAMPEVLLPEANYPGGEARCDWHLNEARCVFLDAFGIEPAGCWPSEGALSEETLLLLARHHFRWTASGSQVLMNSLRRAGLEDVHHPHHHAWQPDEGPACFFRDDGLSDLIGFEYSKWPAEDAVADFLRRLEKRREEALAAGNPSPVLGIIMDGENAWEYYEENGRDFLQALYARLADHPVLNLTTFSEALKSASVQSLPALCAGSWVHGNLSTWIGEGTKNRAWGLLVDAKRAVDSSVQAQDPPVLRQLAICEASDWFWWPGEGELLRDAPEFDALFRRNLAALYELIGVAPPEILAQPLLSSRSDDGDHPDFEAGAMRRSV